MSEQKIKKPQGNEFGVGDTEQNVSRSGGSAIQKTGSFLSSAIGLKSVRKNIGIIKHRASFPLFRRVLSNELKTSKGQPKIINAQEVSDVDIDRSYFWHTIIVAITAPALLWSIFILTKALAIGIKFDVWTPTLNQGLYTSIPMIIFTGSKLYVSWHSRKAFENINRKLGRDA